MSDKQQHLGEFEHVLLLVLMQHQGKSYGTQLRITLKEAVQRDVSIGALYATLDRLQSKGFVVSQLGEPTNERGGRAKRYFEITASGKQALRQTKQKLELLWQGVDLCQIH